MSTETSPVDDTTPLKKAITGKMLFIFILGDVLGAGIYALVGEIAGEVGGALWLPLVVALLNARGITESLRANLVMTVVEVSGLVLIIALAGLVLSRGDGTPSRVLEFDDGTTPALAVLSAALLAFYSFVGFETSANIAEEVRDVRRVYPRALLGAVTTAGVVYVLVGLAVSTVVSPDTLAQSSGPLLEVVSAADAGIPSWLFSLIALIAVANGALLTMIMASRLTFGMARDGLLPAPLAAVLPGRRTPWAAIVATTVVAMILCSTGSVAALAETVVLLLLFVFISTNIAVLVLRKDRADVDHFRTPTILPILALITCVVLLTQQSATTWLRAGLLLVVGVVLYFVQQLTSKRTVST